MWNRRYGWALPSGLAILLAGTGVAVAQATSAHSSAPMFHALPPGSDAAGVALVPHSQELRRSATISPATAEKRARTWLGNDIASSAHVGQVSFGDVTDAAMQVADTPRGQVALTKRTAYVVTFDDLTIPSRGPGGRVNRELNVVIDATTGEYLEAFTVR